MSKNVAVFIDVANLYYSARGQDVDVDYVALLKAATKGRDLIRAYAYSGLDPENENQRKFIDFLTKNGYKVVHKDIRKFGDGRMKANLDIELVVDLFRLQDRMDIAVIISGDGDFAPAIRALQDVGVRCEVISFRPNTSSDLIAVADEFFDIMKILDIGRKKEGTTRSRVMSAPEMPAKEVNPEFGFRDASPHIAAAALAAIKTGGTRRGRGLSSAATNGNGAGNGHAEPAEAPAAAAGTDVAAHDESAESHESRRRRRRGGRGRGRGRREEGNGEAVVAAGNGEAGAGTEPPEVAWQELDDISQVEGIDEELVSPQEGEFTFSEADAATLAELGISPDPAAASKPAGRARSPKAASTEAVTDETPAKPARRRRSPKADTADTAPEAPAGDAAGTAPASPSPRARRSGTKRETPDGEPAAKPAPRRRSTSASGGNAPSQAAPAVDHATSSSTGGEEPQGIWQRFRSARTGR
ncbi:MAG: NYN domain-containing protein [Chloroflexota bacterium]